MYLEVPWSFQVPFNSPGRPCGSCNRDGGCEWIRHTNRRLPPATILPESPRPPMIRRCHVCWGSVGWRRGSHQCTWEECSLAKAQVRQKQRSARFQCFSGRMCGIAIIATLKHCIMTFFNSNQTVKGKGWVPNIMINVPKISTPSVFTVSLKRRQPSRSSGGATGPPNALRTRKFQGFWRKSTASCYKMKIDQIKTYYQNCVYSRSQNGKYYEVSGAVVTIPSEWPCEVSGDFVAIHRSRHQDDLWHCWVWSSWWLNINHKVVMQSKTTFLCPLNQPFFNLPKQRCYLHATQNPPKSSQIPAFTSWFFINTRVTTKLKRKSMCWSPVVVVVRSKSHTKSTEQPPVGGCGWWTGEQWVSSETKLPNMSCPNSV